MILSGLVVAAIFAIGGHLLVTKTRLRHLWGHAAIFIGGCSFAVASVYGVNLATGAMRATNGLANAVNAVFHAF